MRTKEQRSWNVNQAGSAAKLLLPLLLMAFTAVPVHAGMIAINFSATISNDGGTTTDAISGQFTLDSDVLFGIGVGGVGDVILDGSANLFGSTETVDAGSAFSLVTAALRPGYGVLSLIGDYGTGLFALDLASDDFFSTLNVFDDLAAGLSLANLRSFTAAEAFGTTRFVNLVGYATEWEGALTSFEIVQVPAPATLWLALLVAPLLLRSRRRLA